jgi:probable rRNA maturation factor
MQSPKVEIVIEAGDWPAKARLQRLAKRAVKAAVKAIEDSAASPLSRPFDKSKGHPLPQGERAGGELSIVFTDDAAMKKLNKAWRGKDSPTNVLSFPQLAGRSATGGMLLGDVILAAETVAKEAALAEKPLEDHMAHLIIHGFLHLLGYHHEREDEAEKMEQLERVALKSLGISDPYAGA